MATSSFQFAALQALLGVEAVLLRETAVMRGDRFLAEPVGEMARHALAVRRVLTNTSVVR